MEYEVYFNKKALWLHNPERSEGFYLLQQIASCVFVSRKPICNTHKLILNIPESYLYLNILKHSKNEKRTSKK